MRVICPVIGACLLATLLSSSEVSPAYQREIETWRAERVAKLTAPDGWITLVGLHFLKDGANTLGAAKGNDIVLPKGPARLGTVRWAGGKVVLEVEPGAEVRVDGRIARRAELKWDENPPNKPTLVTCGSLTFFAIERGGRKALRVKDSESPRRTHFLGLDYFPIDSSWRIEARWERFEKSRLMPVTNMLGQTAPEPIPGQAVFERGGQTYKLLPIDEGRDSPLFFVISDLTSGKETYPACRFVYVEWPKEGVDTIMLDFNHAENPPCAFTPFATCPLPPKENRLPFAVPVGEKNYRGSHE